MHLQRYVPTYVCVCVYVCMYVCMYIYIYIYIQFGLHSMPPGISALLYIGFADAVCFLFVALLALAAAHKTPGQPGQG